MLGYISIWKAQFNIVFLSSCIVQGTGTVTVSVTDVNDNTPSCLPSLHVLSIAENTSEWFGDNFAFSLWNINFVVLMYHKQMYSKYVDEAQRSIVVTYHISLYRVLVLNAEIWGYTFDWYLCNTSYRTLVRPWKYLFLEWI